MVFARVAEYFSGSATNQRLLQHEQASESTASQPARWEEAVLESEEEDLDAARPPYAHVCRIMRVLSILSY